MKFESIAECSPWSILQYFWPTLSDNWSYKPIFGLFESGRYTQVLLYSHSFCVFFYPFRQYEGGDIPSVMLCGIYPCREVSYSNGHCQNAGKVTDIKGRLLEQAVILYSCVSFHMGTSLKGKNLLPEGANSFL